MAEAAAPTEPPAAPPDPDRLRAAAREVRNDAAPFALAAAGVLIGLALVSRHAHWDLLGHRLWWLWLVVAAPYVCLAATLLFGLGRLVRHDRRREIVIALLALVWIFNVLGLVVLVVSLVAHSGVQITGRQTLFGGGAVWFTNAIAFGLAFWELDCGGPLARALATAPRKPDFQFPQDENPELAREGWAPRLSGLLLRVADQLDRVQPDRCDAAYAARQDIDGGRSHALCAHDSSHRRTRGEHPHVEGHRPQTCCTAAWHSSRRWHA